MGGRRRRGEYTVVLFGGGRVVFVLRALLGGLIGDSGGTALYWFGTLVAGVVADVLRSSFDATCAVWKVEER